MALIQCEHCGNDISDKAVNCPYCNSVLTKGMRENSLCEECNTELPAGAKVCPKCGCPVSEKKEDTTQKVEVASVNLHMKKSTKKIVIAVVAAIILIVMGALIFSVVSANNKKKAAQEAAQRYINNVELTCMAMLDGAVDAETAGNLIKKVWYNAIHEERDSETDKYTRPNGYYVDDFNEALAYLFSDPDFIELTSDIEENQTRVANFMKDLKNPPEEHREAYEAVKEFYDAYLELTNLAVNPTGSLNTYSSAFNEADTETVNCYNAMKLYIED